MGQHHGKLEQQGNATTPSVNLKNLLKRKNLSKPTNRTSQTNDNDNSDINSSAIVTSDNVHNDDDSNTGNVIITIRMLTMASDESNNVTATTGAAAAGATTTTPTSTSSSSVTTVGKTFGVNNTNYIGSTIQNGCVTTTNASIVPMGQKGKLLNDTFDTTSSESESENATIQYLANQILGVDQHSAPSASSNTTCGSSSNQNKTMSAVDGTAPPAIDNNSTRINMLNSSNLNNNNNNNNIHQHQHQNSSSHIIGVSDSCDSKRNPIQISTTSLTTNSSTCLNCSSFSSCSIADKISNIIVNKCRFNSSHNNNGNQHSQHSATCQHHSSNLAVTLDNSVTTNSSKSSAGQLSPSDGNKGAKVKKGWVSKIPGFNKKDKKTKENLVNSVSVEDTTVSKLDANSSGNKSTCATKDQQSNQDTTATASNCCSSSELGASVNGFNCTLSTSSSLSSDIVSNGANVASNSDGIYGTSEQMILPENSSISIISGTSSTSVSGATTTATAFILPDSVPVMSSQPNGRFDSPTTLLGSISNGTSGSSFFVISPFIDVTRSGSHDDEHEDCDEQARWRRAIQIEQGVAAPPGFVPTSRAHPIQPSTSQGVPMWSTVVCSDPVSLTNLLKNQLLLSSIQFNPDEFQRVHSQADYIHCLVPDLEKIISCCFYWGKMDRYEAERLLDGKPEGTFLLRDSAQDDFLFSVSFRKYGRSLHARIEQFNHEFSFDSHDPGVYTANTVTGLLEHYKDPTCVMFFEPMLTLPLHRNFVFSLQDLARATIVSNTTYDGVEKLDIPRVMKAYLKEYHYKQRVHFKRFDDHNCCNDS